MAISAARYSTSTFFKAKVVSINLPMRGLRFYGSNKRSQRASLSVALQSIILTFNKTEFGTRGSTQLVTMGRIR
jgi:hypothetical protein